MTALVVSCFVLPFHILHMVRLLAELLHSIIDRNRLICCLQNKHVLPEGSGRVGLGSVGFSGRQAGTKQSRENSVSR